MNLKHLRDMDKNDLLEALGLEEKRSTATMMLPMIGAAAAGIVIGAAVAFLLAPKAGREIREDLTGKLKDTATSLRDRLGKKGEDQSAATPSDMTGLPENGRRF